MEPRQTVAFCQVSNNYIHPPHLHKAKIKQEKKSTNNKGNGKIATLPNVTDILKE